MAKPVFGTAEWAKYNLNCQSGCSHGCIYCYAKASAMRFKTHGERDWTTEVLKEDMADRGFGKRSGTTMFPTQHDITPFGLDLCTKVLGNILKPGNPVLIVSKPHLACIRHLCLELEPYKDQILFRFTIGSAFNGTLSFWEPGAPDFLERFNSLKWAYEHGFKTSISMEPMLDTVEEAIIACVMVLEPYVTDSIWLGKANRLQDRLKRNGVWENPGVADMARALDASQSDERILSLYEALRESPKVKWKESIKKVVGLDIPTEAGMDI